MGTGSNGSLLLLWRGDVCCGEEMFAVEGGEEEALLLVVGSGIADSMK